MKMYSERVYRIWNAGALLFIAFLAATVSNDLLSNGLDSLGEYVVSAVGAILLAGFWLCMLFECVRNKGLPLRFLWFVFFLIVPVFSAFIYFSTTRSWRGDGMLRVK